MKLKFIGACTSLGVNIDGSDKAPLLIYNEVKRYSNNSITLIQNDKITKKIDTDNNQKNLFSLNKFNQKMYCSISNILKDNYFPLTLGGDHSVTIASALASIKKYEKLGIIWIDAHGDYNNVNTTPSGNIHGFPFATVTGFENTNNLISFHDGNLYDPKNSVLVGARDLDEGEITNLKKSGVTIFTTNDIQKLGINYVMRQAIKIANTNTNGMHISFDIDIIDPKFVPGVSTVSPDGISEEQAYRITDILNKNIDMIKSFDLVEYNPNYDIDNKGLKVATELIRTFIN
jgi:arginase